MKGAWPEECLKASLLWREKKCFKALNSGQRLKPVLRQIGDLHGLL